MASYHHLLEHTKPRYESPAKVFAKLKSKVQREEMCTFENVRVREKHGSEFKSPKKRPASTWMTDELKENQRFGSFRNEAQALTLSPISSPRKTFGYTYSESDINVNCKPVEEMPPVTEIGHVCTPRKRSLLESTAVTLPVSLTKRKQIHTESAWIRNLDGLNGTRRTPVKTQPAEYDCADGVFEEECRPLMSPAYNVMLSPMRKRKCEPWGLNNVSSTAKGFSREVLSQPQDRKISSAFKEDDNNACMEDFSHVRKVSSDQAEASQYTQEPMFLPPRSITKTCEI